MIKLDSFGVQAAVQDALPNSTGMTEISGGSIRRHRILQGVGSRQEQRSIPPGHDQRLSRYRNGFTSGGTPIKIERVTAIADDELLLLWHDFYDEDAEY
ncbi:MAG: hypothetical protein LBI74_01585, partial [Synergistaceae bacterium]|nr:hypothetical protein [Synergistaceae bacterium]